MKPADLTTLPAPLTPPDCDLRGLPYMPLDVIRLIDSDMFAETTGDEFKAAVALWCKSWTQIPAGSLPNKDMVLAHLSGNAAKWKRIKAGAMRGWILCSDDRWYHPVVAEKALAALPGREEFNHKKSADAERKAREREDRKALFEMLKGHGVVPEWNVSTKALRALAAQHLSQQPHGHVTDDERDMSQRVTVSKGECKEKGELTSKTLGSDHRATAQSELGAGEIEPTPVGLLSQAMRAFGINSNPGDLRLIALADQGVSVETVQAACEAAKKAKPNEAIPMAYVLSILERWAKEAAGLNAAGAAQPGATTTLTRAGQATARNMEAWLERKRQEQEQEQKHG